MSPYIVALAQLIWTWLLAPPFHWALALSREWQWELGLAAIGLTFRRRIIEYSIIGVELIREWRTNRVQVGEWYYYGEMEDDEFDGVLASLRERAAREEELAERLQSRAGRLNLGIVRDAVRRRERKAAKLYDEAERLELLRERIELERKNGGGDDDTLIGLGEVLNLMRDLDCGDARIGMRALAELNRIWASFDWERFVPYGAAEGERRRIVTLLRMMASTSSVAEARSALRRALRILKQSHAEWAWDWDREIA